MKGEVGAGADAHQHHALDLLDLAQIGDRRLHVGHRTLRVQRVVALALVRKALADAADVHAHGEKAECRQRAGLPHVHAVGADVVVGADVDEHHAGAATVVLRLDRLGDHAEEALARAEEGGRFHDRGLGAETAE